MNDSAQPLSVAPREIDPASSRSNGSMLSSMADLLLLTFDLDDTLIDTDAVAPSRVGDAVAVARELLGPAAGIDYDAVAETVIATDPVRAGRAATLLRLLDLTDDHPHAARIREAYNRRLVELVEAFGDAAEVLTALRRRVRITVLSNGPEALQRAKLERCGLAGLVDDVVISGAFGVDKPDPSIFLHACARAGVLPSAAAHVGDSLFADVSGARAAGMRAIWRRPRWRAEPTEAGLVPDAVITELRELLTLL